eukprot:8251030-Heterocapsa_arctica.AAC.1
MTSTAREPSSLSGMPNSSALWRRTAEHSLESCRSRPVCRPAGAILCRGAPARSLPPSWRTAPEQMPREARVAESGSGRPSKERRWYAGGGPPVKAREH